MKLPEEIVTDHFVPTVRALLARDLEARGLNQSRIAAALGLSQSAVSKYLTGKLQADPLLARDARVQATIARVGEGLATKALSPFGALSELMALVRELENRGPICMLHEREMPALQGLGCDLCVRLSSPQTDTLREEQETLANLRQAVRLLELSPDFARLRPHVGTNLAMALRHAKDASQVAAVPGGFYELRGFVKAPAAPEFGVSRHVAEVLLAVASADPMKRACLNIASTPAILAACEAAGLRALRIEAQDEKRPANIPARIPKGAAPDVLYHEGDFGIEPIAYLVGVDAIAVAEMALAVLRGMRT